MRPIILTRLLVVGLAAAFAADNAVFAGKDNKQGGNVTFTKDVEGKARASHDEAVDAALEAASNEIAGYLQEQKPSLIWQPDPAYVRERLLSDVQEASNGEWSRQDLNGHTILEKKGEFGVADKPFTYQVRLRVTVTPQELAHMRQLDQPYREAIRHEEVHQRQLGLGKILLGVIALLAAVSGYIRLEDATKGYYTRLLRFGMILVVSAVFVGLWLVS